jgi:hypothetical protein
MSDVYDHYEEDIPRAHEEIETHELVTALSGLTLLRDDLALSSQVFNIATVDQFLMGLEMDFLRSRMDEDTPRDPTRTIFLGAQTEMWIFAVYELMRSWRERAKLAINLAEHGGLEAKIAHLAAKPSWDYGNHTVSLQLTRARDEPGLVQRLREDLLRTHVPFHLLAWVRVQLAKHQEPGNAKSFIRSHPMMDRWTGSLKYELTQGPVIATTMSRRNLADALRGLNDRTVPSPESIASFDEFRKAKPPSFES